MSGMLFRALQLETPANMLYRQNRLQIPMCQAIIYLYVYTWCSLQPFFFGLPNSRFGKRHSTFLEGVDATWFGIGPLFYAFMALTRIGPAKAQHYGIGLTHVEGLTLHAGTQPKTKRTF